MVACDMSIWVSWVLGIGTGMAGLIGYLAWMTREKP